MTCSTTFSCQPLLRPSLLFGVVALFLGQAQAQQVGSANQPSLNVLSSVDFLGLYAMGSTQHIDCDDQGYIYFLSQKTVHKFNGTTLKELPNAVSGTYSNYQKSSKDFFGTIWLYGSGSIATIENDTIVPFVFPEGLRGKSKSGIMSLYRDSTGTLHLGLSAFGYYTISPSGTVTEVLGKSSQLFGIGVTETADSYMFPFFIPQTNSEALLSMECFYLHASGKRTLLKELNATWPRYFIDITKHTDGSHSLSTGTRELVRFRNDSLLGYEVFPHVVSHVFADTKDRLWVGTIDMGFYKIEHLDFSNLEHYWDGRSGVVTEDKEGGLWGVSDSLGFTYISPTGVYNYSSKNGYPQFDETKYLMYTGGHVLCVAPPRGFYELKDSIYYTEIALKAHKPGMGKYDIYPTMMYFDTLSQLLWVAYVGELKSWNGKSWKSYPLKKSVFRDNIIVGMESNAEGQVFGATRSRVFTLSADTLLPITPYEEPDINYLLIDCQGVLWVSRSDGIWKVESGSYQRPFDSMPVSLLYPCDILAATKEAVWIQPRNASLMVLSDQEAYEVFDQEGHPVAAVTLSVAPNGDLWACRDAEVTSLCRLQHNGGHVEVQSFAFDDRAVRVFPHRRFLVTKDRMYAGSSFGLFTQKLSELKEENRAVELMIDELSINHEKVDLLSTYQLKHSENFFNISFDGISYRRLPVQYRYRMEHLDATWYTIEYKQVQYTNLSPGTYQFQVQARTLGANTPWGKTQSIQFNIAKPYWDTWWFWLLLASTLLTVLYGVFKYRLKQVRDKEVLRSKMAIEVARLELRALKAQMNPHFIFNAISSVMYYLAANKSNEAESYLQRFSKLIRAVLENSEKTSVPLEEEVALMGKYVSLESERFKGAPIEFEVAYSDGIDAKTVMIPPMLFQPYIENSIWHGLRQKDGPRHIRFSCENQGEWIQISIEDNGIGRAAAAKSTNSRRSQRSFGMRIASRRIEVLNRQKTTKPQIEDLVEGGKPSGTRVSFFVPIQMYKVLEPHTTDASS